MKTTGRFLFRHDVSFITIEGTKPYFGFVPSIIVKEILDYSVDMLFRNSSALCNVSGLPMSMSFISSFRQPPS